VTGAMCGRLGEFEWTTVIEEAGIVTSGTAECFLSAASVTN